MAVLDITGLRKTYPGFLLDGISFSVREGSIMGFIGRNGAGKTTTLKSILGIVHPDAGDIRYFGLDFSENEREIKQRIGYAGGTVDYYRRKKIADIIAVTKTFYENWDDTEYRRWMDIFHLDPEKTPQQLSEGMKVKLNLVMALSHHAELLILDEPTSGLDPVSREELLEAFTFLKEQGIAILFSTHITSDLEKCADDITYIADGKLIWSGELPKFMRECREKGRGEALDDIMVHYEKQSIRTAFGNSSGSGADAAEKGGEEK